MKTPKILKYLVVTLSLLLGLSGKSYSTEILNLFNLEITEDNPATFVLYGQVAGEFVIVEYSINEGDYQDLSVEVNSLTGTEAQTNKILTRSGQDFEVTEDGNYRLKFKSKGDLNINLRIFSSAEEPEGGTVARFKFDGKIIETENDAEHLKFIFDLQSQDQVKFYSADQKSLLLKVNFSQLDRAMSIGSGANFPITKIGNSTFYVFIDEDNPNLQDQIKKKAMLLFKKSNYGFKDINVSIERPFPPSVKTTNSNLAQNDAVEDPDGDNFLQEFIDQQEQTRIEQREMAEKRLEELRKKAEEDSSNQTAMLAYMQEKDRLREEMLQEEREKARWEASRAVLEINALQKHDEEKNVIKILPRSHLAGGNRISMSQEGYYKFNNKVCLPISLPIQNTEDYPIYNSWFMMVYVGNKARIDTFINIEMPRAMGDRELRVWKQLAINYHRSYNSKAANSPWRYDRGNKPRKLYWPDPEKDREYFSEDVSFAIVRESYFENYLMGESYIAEFEANNIMLMHRRLPLLSTERHENQYFCATNDNLNTPIDVAFYYFIIEAINNNENDSFEYDAGF